MTNQKNKKEQILEKINKINFRTFSNKKTIFWLIFFVLLLIPLFWFKHNFYLLGDDDTGLTYYNPLGALNNFSSMWFSIDSLGNYNPIIGYELPFAILTYLIKFISFSLVNSQLFFFGMIMAGSFYFVVNFLKLITKKGITYPFIIAGLFYALSLQFVLVEYYYLMPSTYVILIAPLFAYCLFKSVESKNNSLLFIAAIVSFFFFRSLVTPVFINFYSLLFFFIIVWGYFQNGKMGIKPYLINFIKLSFYIGLINALTLLPAFVSHFVSDTSAVKDAIVDRSSQTFSMVENLKTELNIIKIKDYLANIFPAQISAAQGFRDYPLYKFYKYSSPLNYIIVLLSLVGFYTFKKRNESKIFLPILITFSVALLFITVDLYEPFRALYVHLMENTSFLNMNRYPSMKFHVPFAFFFSLLIGLGLTYFAESGIKIRLVKIGLWFCFLAILVNSSLLLSGLVFTKPIGSPKTKRILEFNKDYKQLVNDFPEVINDDTNVLLFPLGYGYGAFIDGNSSDQIYRSTISGFKNQTQTNMFGNLQVISSVADPTISVQAKKYFYYNDISGFLALAKKLNIKYVLVAKDTSNLKRFGEIRPEYTFDNPKYLEPFKTETPVYENNGYIIYKLKNSDEISHISAGQDDELYFNKVSDFLYLLKIKTTSPSVIKFSERFSNQWKLVKIDKKDFNCVDPQNYAKSYSKTLECKHENNNIKGNLKLLSLKRAEVETSHFKDDNYGNAWNIDSNGEYSYYALVMDSQKYLIYGFAISLLVLITFFALLVANLFRKRR